MQKKRGGGEGAVGERGDRRERLEECRHQRWRVLDIVCPPRRVLMAHLESGGGGEGAEEEEGEEEMGVEEQEGGRGGRGGGRGGRGGGGRGGGGLREIILWGTRSLARDRRRARKREARTHGVLARVKWRHLTRHTEGFHRCWF